MQLLYDATPLLATFFVLKLYSLQKTANQTKFMYKLSYTSQAG